MPEWVQVAAGIEGIECASASEFLQILDPTSSDWGWLPAVQRHRWIFRGHGDSSWSLLASAWRTAAPADSLRHALALAESRVSHITNVVAWDHTSTLPGPPQPDLAVARKVIVQANAELSLISAFVHRADELGFETPGRLPYAYHHDALFEETRPIAADDFLQLTGDGLDYQAALAQHHGIPTRLLDWTEDPLTAAFFAATKDCGAERLAVWALHEEAATRAAVPLWDSPEANRVDLGLRVVRPRRYGNANIRAQRGVFTVPWGAGCYALVNHGSYPTLEQFVGAARGAHANSALLRCVTLPRSEASDLLQLLQRHRVTYSRLLPSLDSVASEVVSILGGSSE